MAEFPQIHKDLAASSDPRDQLKVLTHAISVMDSEMANLDAKLDDVMLVLQEMPLLLKNGNHKVVLKALAFLGMIVDRLNATSMQQSYQILVHSLRDRLSHSKSLVQKEAMNVLVRVMHVMGAWSVFELVLRDVAGHKSPMVRRNLLELFSTACAVYGGPSLNFRKMLPQAVKCLNDADVRVRREAIAALESMYIWCGDDIMAAVESHAGNHMADSIWKQLVRTTNNTEVVPESQRVNFHEPWRPPTQSSANSNSQAVSQQPLRSHSVSRKSAKRSSPRPYSPSQQQTHRSRRGNSISTLNNNKDEEEEEGEWGILGGSDSKSVEPVVCATDGEVEAVMADIGATLLVSDQAFWDRRLDALRKIEGLLLGNAQDSPAFLPSLGLLHQPLITQITDLRSAVVREVCRQVCMLATSLNDRDFELCADALMPSLVSRCSLKVDVMVRSADMACRMIIAHSSLNKAIGGLIRDAEGHKNALIRTNSMRYLCLLLETVAEDGEKHRHVHRHGYEQAIGQCILKALADSKGTMREQGRNTYHIYERVFPESARNLYSKQFSERIKVRGSNT